MAKIRCNAKVRELLCELDTAFGKLSVENRALANRDTPENIAIAVGAEREATKTWIVGIAWRINKASKGIE